MTHPHTGERLTLPLAVVIAGGLIGLGIYLGASKIATFSVPTSKQATVQPTSNTTAIAPKPAPVTNQDHIRGNVNAKVMVIEYSDLECPFCKQFHTTLKQVISKFDTNDVAWVYRHFPLPIHDRAVKEAEASECAAEQGGDGAFWAFIERVFEVSPTNNKLEPSELPKIAAHIGINVPAFEKCLASGKYKVKIDTSVQEGKKAGASGTPYTLIISKNGTYPIKGAVSAEAVEQKIRESLGK